jgi:succinyl-CoA synthetase beta subunit
LECSWLHHKHLLKVKKVRKVLIAEDVYQVNLKLQFYVSVLLNRASGRNMIMYSTEGGMDIEEVADTLLN